MPRQKGTCLPHNHLVHESPSPPSSSTLVCTSSPHHPPLPSLTTLLHLPSPPPSTLLHLPSSPLTWCMKRYWSRVCTMPARSCRSVLTTLRMSTFGSSCRIPWIPMSTAISTPVRPIPAEQCTTAGPALSAILMSLCVWGRKGR